MAKNKHLTNPRVVTIADRVNEAIVILRAIKLGAQTGRKTDQDLFTGLADVISSLRHNCEMLDEENVASK